MADVVIYGVMGLSVLLMLWIVPRIVPKTPAWLLVLIALGCAALAAGFFYAYQWAGYPVLAYIDGITFGLFAVQAAFSLWLRRLAPSGEPLGARSAGESRAG
ncbi:MAG TPA: hypothetical protein VH643_21635 [Gemmataceae bacterium]|jgi:hypothetical protein